MRDELVGDVTYCHDLFLVSTGFVVQNLQVHFVAVDTECGHDEVVGSNWLDIGAL